MDLRKRDYFPMAQIRYFSCCLDCYLHCEYPRQLTHSWLVRKNQSDNLNWLCSMKRRVIWACYQIRKIAGCACAGNAGNVFTATVC